MEEVALGRGVLGGGSVEWWIKEVGEGKGLFLVAASNWKESLGPDYLLVRAVLQAPLHASDTKESWLGILHRS